MRLSKKEVEIISVSQELLDEAAYLAFTNGDTEFATEVQRSAISLTQLLEAAEIED